MMRAVFLSLLTLVLLTIHAPKSYAMEIMFPINCKLGENCFISKYVDHFFDKTVQKDFRCRSSVTSTNNKGTGIKVSESFYRTGVPVYAVADGIVVKKRDSIPDKRIMSAEEAQKASITGYGNVILIEHEDDYATLYAHLQLNSIPYKIGDQIKKGDQIGVIGLSGLTEYPHLNFEVYHRDQIMDPFTGTKQNNICDLDIENTLWDDRFMRQYSAYSDTKISDSGFTDIIPTKETYKEISNTLQQLTPDTKQLIFWINAQAVEQGDEIVLSLFDTDGNLMIRKAKRFEESHANYLFSLGKKETDKHWKAGQYNAFVQLWRDGNIIVNNQHYIQLKESINPYGNQQAPEMYNYQLEAVQDSMPTKLIVPATPATIVPQRSAPVAFNAEEATPVNPEVKHQLPVNKPKNIIPNRNNSRQSVQPKKQVQQPPKREIKQQRSRSTKKKIEKIDVAPNIPMRKMPKTMPERQEIIRKQPAPVVPTVEPEKEIIKENKPVIVPPAIEFNAEERAVPVPPVAPPPAIEIEGYPGTDSESIEIPVPPMPTVIIDEEDEIVPFEFDESVESETSPAFVAPPAPIELESISPPKAIETEESVNPFARPPSIPEPPVVEMEEENDLLPPPPPMINESYGIIEDTGSYQDQ